MTFSCQVAVRAYFDFSREAVDTLYQILQDCHGPQSLLRPHNQERDQSAADKNGKTATASLSLDILPTLGLDQAQASVG